MFSLGLRVMVAIVLSLLLALVASSLAPQPAVPGVPAAEGKAIALKAPPFVQPAYAQEGPDAADAPAAPLGFPQDEAGISAYFKSASPVNLADVRGVFRVIEAQTADYIIGSVDVADYAEAYDVHVYIHKDGWFMAYYLRSDPVAKMVDIRYYNGSRIETLLEKTLNVVAASAGVTVSGTSFYDFRYPNASHLMFVGENDEDGNSFTIQLPSSYTYFERSWTVITWGGWDDDVYFAVNGARMPCAYCANPYYGTIAPAQFLPDTVHTIAVDNEGVLVLVYRVP